MPVFRGSCGKMSLIGNILFFVFGGFVIFLGYLLGGIVRDIETGREYP